MSTSTSGHFSLSACLLTQCQDIWVRLLCVCFCFFWGRGICVDSYWFISQYDYGFSEHYHFVQGTMPGLQFQKYLRAQPMWLGGWVSNHEPRDHQFDPRSGHIPRLQARSSIGGVLEAAHRCSSLTCMSLPC